MISDTGFTTVDTIRKVLQDYSIVEYFEYGLFSEIVGFNKPNKSMYLPIINNEYGIDSSKIVHIGDQYDTDVVIAKSVNVNSIFLNNDKQEERTEDKGRKHFLVANLVEAKKVLTEFMDT